MELRVDRFLNAVYVWCLQRLNPDDIDKWMFQLNEPLPGGPVTQATVEAEMESFDAFAGAFGVKKPQSG